MLEICFDFVICMYNIFFKLYNFSKDVELCFCFIFFILVIKIFEYYVVNKLVYL